VVRRIPPSMEIQYEIGHTMDTGRDEIYGTLGMEERYSLVQG
jgi:hypothetical protein